MTEKNHSCHSLPIIDEMRIRENNESCFINENENALNVIKNFHMCTQLFENLYEGILLIESSSRIIRYVNNKAAEIFGLSKEDIIGKVCNNFICPSNKGNCPILDLGKQYDSSKREIVEKDGRKVPILKNAKKILLDGNPYVLESFISIDFHERVKNEELKRKKKLLEYQKILLDLSKKQFQDFNESLRFINEIVTNTLDINRCGFWLFNEDHSHIFCMDTYVKNNQSHEQNTVLYRDDYPQYFDSIGKNIVIDASDALNDFRTKEFTENYLQPLTIVSMFDFPVRLHGSLVGIICCEHTYEKRLLDEDEIGFVKSIADQVSLQYEKQNRLKLERKLKESKKQTDAILEAAADGIRIIDNNFKIINANKTMKNLSKKDGRELIGSYCYQTLPSKFCGTDECSLKKVISLKTGFLRETQRKSADGISIDCIEVVNPYKDDQGNIIGVIEDIRDISYLKKTQQDLIDEKKKVQEFLDVTTVIIIVLDVNGSIILVNKKCSETLGYHEDELIGKNWFEIAYLPEVIEEKKQLFSSYVNGQTSFPNNELREVISKQNEKRIIKWNATKIYNKSGKISSILSSGEDITREIKAKEAKRKADAILEKRTRAFRILYNTALQVENQPKQNVIEILCKNFIEISQSNKCIFAIYNKKVNSLFIYGIDPLSIENDFYQYEMLLDEKRVEIIKRMSHGEIKENHQVTKNSYPIIPEKVFDDFQLQNSTIFQISKPLGNKSCIIGFIIKNHDQKLAMKDLIDTYFNFAGIIIQRIQSLEDLASSEQKFKNLSNELEDKVVERTEHIQKLLKQKDAFINQLGHDLKHPINPLMNLLPILEKKNTDPKCQEIFTVLKRNTGYMKNLVVKTIKFAQLNAPSTEFTFEKTNLYSEIESILEKEQYLFNQKHINVVNNIKNDILVDIDTLHFSELIDNLLNNAVKYNHEKGEVVIEGFIKDDQIVISVSDTGIGMTLDQIDHIFEEFYKADPARHDFESSGLGMSICKRIVEKHKGKIWVESEGVGKGTIVNVSIPLNQ